METATLKDFQYYLLKKAFSENIEKRDLILEFIDKVLLIEIKRSQSDKPSSLEVEREQEYQISDLKIKRKIIQVPGLDKTKQTKKKTVFKATPAGMEKKFSLEHKPIITRNRFGNGHKKEKVRKLYDWEKNIIRFEFIKLNGQIYEDACLKIKARLGKEVSIFQVTGFVTLLHKYVSLGKLELPDMASYIIHIKQKHKLWVQYERNRTRRLAS
ncbi:hypothetical protein DRQ07_00670 [candidate division KSB1 bacterium]|nr:MAG: hypothetical protein DRQ07_00670 [candidate division KSB1 bacterium]